MQPLGGSPQAMNQSITTAWNEASELKSFLARFSYMFPLTGSERRRAYVFFRGWMPTFAQLCKRVDAILGEDKRDYEWVRIREKFGAPSLSYVMRGQARHVIHAHRPTAVRRIVCAPVESFEPVTVAVQEAVLWAELELRDKCIVCGTKSTITNDQGPWASLCVHHRTAPLLESLNQQRAMVWTIAQLQES